MSPGPPMTEPQPQPEREEPKLAEPGPRDLSKRDYGAILIRAGKQALKHHLTNPAAAHAYYGFLAIPSILLVAVGVFSLVGDRSAVTEIIDRLDGIAPEEALTLLRESLDRVTELHRTQGSR